MSEVTCVRRIAARPSIVFDALTSAEGMAFWWSPDDGPVISAASDPRVGGRFRIRFRKLDGSEHECSGEFLELEEPHRIVMRFEWTSGGVPEERDRTSHVELHLRLIDTGTELTVTHAGLYNEASARNHSSGWAAGLDKLVRRFAESSRLQPE
jgi:uncharacterized protein YndB with AHSA1/START domain